tara:strand:- start:12 stop:122 length:111 start_codon:yes stop_codon:yes gene_type:complete
MRMQWIDTIIKTTNKRFAALIAILYIFLERPFVYNG